MQRSSPIEPSLQMTPISGIGPQPSASSHGVVLGGGAHVVRHAHGPSFSLPQSEPWYVVPDGQTLASGFAPHSLSSHARYETESSGDGGSTHEHEPVDERHCGRDDFVEGGTSPQADAEHGAMKSSASRTVAVSSPLCSPVSSAGGADGGVVVVEPVHATRKRTAKRCEGRFLSRWFMAERGRDERRPIARRSRSPRVGRRTDARGVGRPGWRSPEKRTRSREKNARDQSQVRCHAQRDGNSMHARSPSPPSLQMTPISGFGPQPSGFGHGVVLGGGAQWVVHLHGASSSLPHELPPNVVPIGQMFGLGATPHSASAHCR
jgi:hypothetical protein